jgi:GAF domain-containing protein
VPRVDRCRQHATGSIAADAHKLGLRSAVGSPIIVNGRLWGAIGAASSRSEPLPADAGTRIADFTELVATAIANVQVRTEVLRLTEEQAALRRVATMVARACPAEEVFAKVAEEMGVLLETETVGIDRFEPGGDATVVGSWGKYREAFPVGSRLKLAGESVTALVYRTRRPVRVGSYEQASGAVAANARKIGLRSAVGSPIVVNGRLWGAIGAATSRGEPMPSNAESWIAQFTELVATAIANVQARAEVERLAGEQTALRRVATLVALGTAPDDVFAAVSEEVARLLPVEFADMGRYESDGTVTFVATWSSVGDPWPLGSRWTLGGHNLNTIVFETGRPARMDNYADASGPIGIASRETGVRSAVGTPIIVEGRLWGVITADSTLEQPLPADTEARLASFTELVATAIANAESRADLAASRARIVAAADETRRQIERDLHDRAQQQLVSLMLELRVAEATETSEMGELRAQLARTARGLDGVLEELREISRGIHPAVLSQGGLEPAL